MVSAGLPEGISRSKKVEEVFGKQPINQFNEHFSAMVQKARTKPREAIVHSMKAQDAVCIYLMAEDLPYWKINCMFRATRVKILQRMYSGLLYTCRRIVSKLTDEGFGIAPMIKERMY